MKFIHTADLHLGISLQSASFAKTDDHQKRSRELNTAFFALCDIVEQRGIDLFIIAGDLFDHPRVKPTLVESVFERLSRLPAEVFIVIGNHDTFLHNRAYETLRQYENIHFFDHENHVVRLDEVDVYGFNTKDFDGEALEHYHTHLNKDKANVLCLHGDVFNAKDEHYLMSLNTLKQYTFDYIALGHIHKHQMMDKHIAYSGNLEPFDFSETTQKGYIQGTLKPQFTAKFIPSAKRKFHLKTLTLTPEDTVASIQNHLDKYAKSIKENDFVRLVFEGVRSRFLELDATTKASLKAGFHHLEFKDKSKIDLDFEALKKAYRDTIIAHLIEDYEANLEDETSLRIALQALLDTEEGVR